MVKMAKKSADDLSIAVSDDQIDTTQPNMSQHLNTLYLAGVLDKRRDGVQIYYRIVNNNIVNICRAVCKQTDLES